MEIKSIDFVSTLQWKCINDECLICNNSIGDNCIKCDQLICNTKNCLSMYQKNNNSLKCPMCNIEWTNK